MWCRRSRIHRLVASPSYVKEPHLENESAHVVVEMEQARPVHVQDGVEGVPAPVEEELRRLAGTVVVAQVQDVLHLLGLHQLTQPSVRVDVEVVHCKMYANFVVSTTF